MSLTYEMSNLHTKTIFQRGWESFLMAVSDKLSIESLPTGCTNIPFGTLDSFYFATHKSHHNSVMWLRVIVNILILLRGLSTDGKFYIFCPQK